MRILLINTNRMHPPTAPIGLDYVAAVLQAAGHRPDLLDLCFGPDTHAALDTCLSTRRYDLIGLSFRNTDECFYPGRGWFPPDLRDIVQRVRAHDQGLVVLGGVGFSIMPEAILRETGADVGVAGEGEFAMLALAAGRRDVPGVIWQEDRALFPPLGKGGLGGSRALGPQDADLAALPPMRRDFIDNDRYYREGGQIGFETKRGCAAGCVYCADPVSKGRRVRLRPPDAVADELAALADRGILHLHTCDAEFNRPAEHALAVSQTITARGLGGQLRWYAYCAPTPFGSELAGAMRAAGCVGINFGADSGDDAMLRRLGRDYRPEALAAARQRCRDHGLVCMFDLLLGGPGETADSVRRSLDFIREISPERVGLSVGLRVYPGTPLAKLALREPRALHGPGASSRGFALPTYYLSAELGEGIFPLVSATIGQDRRFFFSDPTDADRNYNYSDNPVLTDAIRRGYRGAYWDILRRLQEGLPPA
jgi:radical SAM superfamily enzyme YgiQ (UPF0313 family)